eukprot:Rhum_TRINITY_DN2959_c0_g1::Rhum_TRINITY_DN2959_c0_g1_i1::g.9051::m.9051
MCPRGSPPQKTGPAPSPPPPLPFPFPKANGGGTALRGAAFRRRRRRKRAGHRPVRGAGRGADAAPARRLRRRRPRGLRPGAVRRGGDRPAAEGDDGQPRPAHALHAHRRARGGPRGVERRRHFPAGQPHPQRDHGGGGDGPLPGAGALRDQRLSARGAPSAHHACGVPPAPEAVLLVRGGRHGEDVERGDAVVRAHDTLHVRVGVEHAVRAVVARAARRGHRRQRAVAVRPGLGRRAAPLPRREARAAPRRARRARVPTSHPAPAAAPLPPRRRRRGRKRLDAVGAPREARRTRGVDARRAARRPHIARLPERRRQRRAACGHRRRQHPAVRRRARAGEAQRLRAVPFSVEDGAPGGDNRAAHGAVDREHHHKRRRHHAAVGQHGAGQRVAHARRGRAGTGRGAPQGGVQRRLVGRTPHHRFVRGRTRHSAVEPVHHKAADAADRVAVAAGRRCVQ